MKLITKKVTVHFTGKDKLTAGDLNQFMHSFEVLNPDQPIAVMNPEVNFNMTFTINKGRGYVPSEENKSADDEFGVIAIDSIHTPIKNVKFSVENYRVEQKNRLRKVDFRNHHQWVYSSQGCFERSGKNPDLSLHAVLRRENHSRYRREIW